MHLKNSKIIVIKIGSSLIVDKNRKNTGLSSANCYQNTPLGITVTHRARRRSDVPDAS